MASSSHQKANRGTSGAAAPEDNHLPGETFIDFPKAAERSSRRSKRGADDGEGDLVMLEHSRREKRQRKVSAQHQVKVAEQVEVVDMDIDDISDTRPIRRGKKRGRAEAGSTFGGDESVSDDENEERLQRHRKRRQRKSGVSHRGQKRGRDFDQSDGESEDHHRTAGKAARRRQNESTASDGDVSMDGLQFSKDPLCRGRRIGEEWEAHGAHFKVGTSGQRLRKVLVKTGRPKFPMVVSFPAQLLSVF